MTEHEAVVQVQGLQRSFNSLEALAGISFEIHRGQVLGFIGANGAGKTTTMRIMATLDLPSAGSVKICGHDVVEFPDLVRRRIGWMPDSYGRYPYTTVYEYLDFYARAFGFSRSDRRARIEEVMEFTDLAPLAARDIDALSKGMAQRLCLGRMLLPDPEVLIMDEPAAGLDPRARVEFKHLVRLLAQDNKTVFVSSHILSELEDMCDSILFIDKGRIVYHGATAALKQAGAKTVVRIKVADSPEKLQECVLLIPGIALLEVLKDGCRIILDSSSPEAQATVLRRMVQEGIAVTDFHQEERKLEDAFIAMLKTIEENEQGEGG